MSFSLTDIPASFVKILDLSAVSGCRLKQVSEESAVERQNVGSRFHFELRLNPKDIVASFRDLALNGHAFSPSARLGSGDLHRIVKTNAESPQGASTNGV